MFGIKIPIFLIRPQLLRLLAILLAALLPLHALSEHTVLIHAGTLLADPGSKPLQKQTLILRLQWC